MIFALAQSVVLSSGWRRRLLALLCGACGALAMAPLDIVPALIVPMTVAVWLIDGCADGRVGRRALLGSLWSAADAGWWWGLGYGVAGLWWLGDAFLAEPDLAWLMPLGVLGLPAYLALYAAFGFALARLLWPSGPLRLLALAVALTVGEILRGTLLTGFPWNEFGMALGGTLVLAQTASLVGVHGLTLLAVALAAAPATLADQGGPGRRDFRRLAPTALALLGLAGLALFGVLRLAGPVPGSVAGVRLRLVQPNTPIDADFSYANKDAILQHYLTLSDRATSPKTAGLADATQVIWPESPFPFVMSRDAEALAAIGAALPRSTVLVTGAARAEPGPSGGQTRYFNAIQVVTRGGTVVASYDKVHLVPFGEYLPFDGALSRLGLHHFVHLPGGFEAGTAHRLLAVPGLPPVAPIVCYEAIFSGEVVPPEARAPNRRPGLLLNVTDDGWFGFTAGPYQHFAQARLRTIEEGLPLVRVASTGLSAIVDPMGRVAAVLPLGAENVLDGPLPQALPPPPFARFGNAVPFAMLGLGLGLLVGLRVVSKGWNRSA